MSFSFQFVRTSSLLYIVNMKIEFDVSSFRSNNSVFKSFFVKSSLELNTYAYEQSTIKNWILTSWPWWSLKKMSSEKLSVLNYYRHSQILHNESRFVLLNRQIDWEFSFQVIRSVLSWSIVSHVVEQDIYMQRIIPKTRD